MDKSVFCQLRPIARDYAILPIEEGFNWSEVLAEAAAVSCDRRNLQLYLVVFRSVRREDADAARLKALDDRAYAEAITETPGLLFYFRGELNEKRQCLSFCLWESVEQARRAAQLPAHRAAALLADEIYEHFYLERWIVVKDLADGQVCFYPVEVANEEFARRTQHHAKRLLPLT
jgi:hypothetical protein